MDKFAETANVDYRLSLADPGKQTYVSIFRLQKTKFAVSVFHLQRTN
jgi:hypothetical protein